MFSQSASTLHFSPFLIEPGLAEAMPKRALKLLAVDSKKPLAFTASFLALAAMAVAMCFRLESMRLKNSTSSWTMLQTTQTEQRRAAQGNASVDRLVLSPTMMLRLLATRALVRQVAAVQRDQRRALRAEQHAHQKLGVKTNLLQNSVLCRSFLVGQSLPNIFLDIREIAA